MSPSRRARVAALLEESPLTVAAVIADVRHLLAHGEWEMAFGTMCSWIYEDDLPITRQHHARLVALAEDMATPESVRGLDELLAD